MRVSFLFPDSRPLLGALIADLDRVPIVGEGVFFAKLPGNTSGGSRFEVSGVSWNIEERADSSLWCEMAYVRLEEIGPGADVVEL
jgi:hypothetical protein